MKRTSPFCTVLLLLLAAALPASDKTRIFIAEGEPILATAEGQLGESKGTVTFKKETASRDVVTMKTFAERCPHVTITSDRDKAEYIVFVRREDISPVSIFVKENHVAVFNREQDLLYSATARKLSNVVKGACAAMKK